MHKDKPKKKSAHALDQWPPPRKEKTAEDEKNVRNLPRNPSYRDPDEYLDAGVEPVFDTETQAEQIEKDEEEKQDEEEKDEK